LLLFKDKVNCNKKIKKVMRKLNLNEFKIKKLNITLLEIREIPNLSSEKYKSQKTY